ncbi:amidase [Paraburkholderia silvatlantica]|uniref:Amidase n=1 Tax=Paraburkholderia silvatlantica TaxID=321895 RepID=A0ABR6FJC0_9BURK|nr:amidase [Paraburkholderia silvatlantica]
MSITKEVEDAVLDAGRRLADAGWTIEPIDDVPLLRDAGEVQERLWLGDGFPALADAVARDGDPGAQAVVDGMRAKVAAMPENVVVASLVRRTTLTRAWRLFLAEYPVLLLPVSGELPFPDNLDMQGAAGFQRVWDAQLTMRALPAMGLPGLVVSTGMVKDVPVGVQVVAGHFREDLCLLAGKAIEERGAPPSPIDPAM